MVKRNKQTEERFLSSLREDPNVTLACDVACRCNPWQITFTTSSNTNDSLVSDFNKNLKAMRDWKVTLHGQIDGQKEPVPQVFQDAFKDGELKP